MLPEWKFVVAAVSCSSSSILKQISLLIEVSFFLYIHDIDHSELFGNVLSQTN